MILEMKGKGVGEGEAPTIHPFAEKGGKNVKSKTS